MPEDINSRIVISAESREAEQSIRNVTGELQNAIAAREKYLQLLKESAQYSEKTTTPPVQTVNFDPEGKMADNINRLSGIASHVISRLENIADKLNIVSQNIEGVTSRIRTMDSNVSVIPDKAETATESLKNVGNISFDNTLTGLDKIKVNLDEITDARTKELQIAKAQVNFELAEHKSMIAAQKAYNAELQMGSLEKLKAIYARKGDIEGVDKLSAAIERNRGKLLELKSEEASANLTAYHSKKILDNLSQATDGAANSTDKLTKCKAALRTVSRLLHMDLGEGNAAMLKAGIIAAGAAAAVKLVGFAYSSYRKSLREYADDLKSYSENQREVTQRLQERIDREESAIQTVQDLSNKENRSIEESVKLASAIRTLGGDFEKLAEKSALAAGGVADFSKISEAARLKNIERQRQALKAELNDLKGEREQQTTIRDTAGVPIWFGGNVRIGGKQEVLEAQKELELIGQRQLEINKKLYELKKEEENLKKDSDTRRKAQAASDENAYADAQEALEDRIGNLNKQREIQELTNKGLLREAELLRINMKLDQERTKLSGQALTAFDEQRQNILEAEMALFDTRSAGKQKGERGKRGENLLASMAKEFFKFRATTQGAISANSVEGMRLQSRIFTNTSTDPAKQSADHLKKIEDQNKTIVNAVQTVSRLLTGISGNGLKLAGVATKKY